MKKRIQKFFRKTLNYVIMRARSDDYYDHSLARRIKLRYSLWKEARNPKDAVRLQQLPYGDRIVGRDGEVWTVDEALAYKHNDPFIRFRKGKPIAVYTLKKKSDTLAYFVSVEMGPIEVKKL